MQESRAASNFRAIPSTEYPGSMDKTMTAVFPLRKYTADCSLPFTNAPSGPSTGPHPRSKSPTFPGFITVDAATSFGSLSVFRGS